MRKVPVTYELKKARFIWLMTSVSCVQGRNIMAEGLGENKTKQNKTARLVADGSKAE